MDRANFVPNNANLGLLQGLIEAGLSDTVIGERLGINRSTVWRWRARLDADLPLEDGRGGNSGVHKVSDEQLIGAVGRLEREPFASLELVNREGNFGVTTKTLSKAIQQRTDIRFRRPAKKPQLRCANEVARLLYAQQHVGRTPEQWRKTVFMDEKTFSSTKDGRVGVWRPIGTRLDKEYVKETTISGRHSIAFWGCMTGDGMSQLFEVDRTLTSPQYLDILDNWFYPSILEHYPDEDEIFIVEDNSPIHTARVIREWYDEHPHLRRLGHPARSPDLNVIENMWAMLTSKWIPADVATPNAMRQKLNADFTALRNNRAYFETLTSSMPRRLQSIIDRDGSHINY